MDRGLAFGHNGYRDDAGSYKFKTAPGHEDARWEPLRFAWPGRRARLLQRVDRAVQSGTIDVYVCPYLMRPGAGRHKGDAVERRLIHADYDLNVEIDGRLGVELGAFIVSSGTGLHQHVYIPLAEPVDPETHRTLCKARRDKLGCPDSKITDSDVLRLPGTFNLKPKR